MADTTPEAYERASIGCSRRRTTASVGRVPGSTSRATPTRTATRRTTGASIWKYRDWVIDALNRDMPFDQFTIEQIAGDMLPDATTSQQIASGFHRNAMTNEEGGVDPDESMYEVLVDRVEHDGDGVARHDARRARSATTTSTIRSPRRTTSGCSRSSPTRRLREPDVRRRHALLRATLDLATPDAGDSARKELQAEVDRLEQELKTVDAGRRARRRSSGSSRLRCGRPHGRRCATSRDRHQRRRADASARRIGAGIRRQSAADVVHGDRGHDAAGHHRSASRDDAGSVAAQRRAGPRRVRALPRHRHSTSAVAPAIRPAGRSRRRASRSIRDAQGGRLCDAVRACGAARLRKRRRTTAAARIVGDQRHARRRTACRATPSSPPTAPFGIPGGTRITVRIDHLDGTIGQGIGRFRLSVTDCRESARGRRPGAARCGRRWRCRCRAQRPAQADELAAFFRSTSAVAEADARRARRGAEGARRPADSLDAGDEGAPVVRAAVVRAARARQLHGARASASTPARPARCHPMRDDQPVNRLGLARWLVDANNPLVARVAVNRLWEQIFGRGLVETSEDFGAQGAPPTHPELLDWLATEFVAQRLEPEGAASATIVLSATYRQSSAVPPQLAERDPVQPAARARPAGPPGSRDGPRRRARRERPAQRRRCAGRASSRCSRDGIWNMPYSTRQVDDERRRGSLPPQPVHVLAPDVAVPELHDLRRDQPRVLHRAPRPHQHAAAGADAAQRSGVVRGGAGAGRGG